MPSGFSSVQPYGSLTETLSLVPGSFETHSVVWTGSRYEVAYAGEAGTWVKDLFLTHINRSETLPLIRDRVTISATDLDERYVALIAPAGRPVRIVYTREAPEPQYGGVSRLFLRDEIDAPRRRAARVQ